MSKIMWASVVWTNVIIIIIFMVLSNHQLFIVNLIVFTHGSQLHRMQSINQAIPVTPRRRWGTPTDASAVMVAACPLQRECIACKRFVQELLWLVMLFCGSSDFHLHLKALLYLVQFQIVTVPCVYVGMECRAENSFEMCLFPCSLISGVLQLYQYPGYDEDNATSLPNEVMPDVVLTRVVQAQSHQYNQVCYIVMGLSVPLRLCDASVSWLNGAIYRCSCS